VAKVATVGLDLGGFFERATVGLRKLEVRAWVVLWAASGKRRTSCSYKVA